MDSTFDTSSWEGPAIGLVDLDAFFASVEQLDHPEWRGRPVVVGGSPDKRGVVSTASYEARRYGVHSAMPAAEARRLCPEAIWTQGHFDRYREMSRRVMDIVGDETPLVEQVSIDEAFFDISPGRFSRESPVEICRRIQERVATTGVTCSIGLGVNKTVAKIASERDKPRGLTVVWPGTERDFLAPLPVRAMSGVGAATERRLREHGIKTLGELADASPEELRRGLGVMGPRLVERASGAERSIVSAAAEPDDAKSVSNERTFATDLTEEDEVRAAILSIASLVGRRLRRKGLAGSTVTLKIRYDFEHTRTAQTTLASPTDDESVFGKTALELLPTLWGPGMPVRLIGVAMSSFDGTPPRQLSLFDGEGRPTTTEEGYAGAAAGTKAGTSPEERRALVSTTDEVRERFGDAALSYGRDLRFRGRTSDTAPMHKEDD